MGAYLLALTCGIALDRLAFCRTSHLYIRQYKSGQRGSVLSHTAARGRLEAHPQGAHKHFWMAQTLTPLTDARDSATALALSCQGKWSHNSQGR